LPIQGNADVELRVGVAPAVWNLQEWEGHSDLVPVPALPAKPSGKAAAPGKAASGTAAAGAVADKAALRTINIDAAKYVGKSVVIAVRVRGPKGHNAVWSNPLALEVLPALAVPRNLEAMDIPNAVHLQWSANASEFWIFRKLESEDEWTRIGDSTKAAWDDVSFVYGKPWQYYVQSVRKVGDSWAESDPSQTLPHTPKDVFPPAVPGGLVVIPGIRTIELVWDRVADADLAGYRIYRNGQMIADALVTPAYSDKGVVAGVKYQYQVSAVDQAGNESQKCAPMEGAME
jgi:hypothetical protein